MEHHQGRMAEGIIYGFAERQQDAGEDIGGSQVHLRYCGEVGRGENEEGGAQQLQEHVTDASRAPGLIMTKLRF